MAEFPNPAPDREIMDMRNATTDHLAVVLTNIASATKDDTVLCQCGYSSL
jgi:CDGSH-type Zn-finger protein